MHGESTLTKEEITALLKLDGLVWSSRYLRKQDRAPDILVETESGLVTAPSKVLVTIYDFEDVTNLKRNGYWSRGYGTCTLQALRYAFKAHNDSYQDWKEKHARR